VAPCAVRPCPAFWPDRAGPCAGNKWVEMVPLLNGRTANAIKNRFNATLLPRIRQAGRTLAKTNPGIFERDVNGAPIGIPVLPGPLMAATCPLDAIYIYIYTY